jgi:hypothetical protein
MGWHQPAIPFVPLGIPVAMKSSPDPFYLRRPGDPSPSPIKEPADTPEDPRVPVREPDPEEPNQI